MVVVCPHIDDLAKQVVQPRASEMVHREECTLCFDGQDDPDGVCVCLHCFNGGCLSHEKGHDHAQLHYTRTGHALGLVIKRTPKEVKQRDDEEPPMKKLAIVTVPDAERYNYAYHLKCFLCPEGMLVDTSSAPQLQSVTDSVKKSLSAANQSEVKAWEEEIEACEHTLCLEQESLIEPGKISPTCSCCELNANLWLCMTCGLVNCGRQQFGGVGGNGHALQHFNETGHQIGLKLGTITPEGGGDIYCYACNDAKIDHSLTEHLNTFGIEVLGQVKTEKSMTELQIEHNLNYDFSMDVEKSPPVFGPGLTGLANLGNSCYMASVLQSAFSLPAYRKRYAESNESHFEICSVPLPADCLECQMQKLSSGLLSGRYSHAARNQAPPAVKSETPFGTEDEDKPRFQEGVKPAMFKALVGKGHVEFSTMRQQDSEEFLQHFLASLRKEAQKKGFSPELEASETFRFSLEQRLQCTECKGVSYRTDQVDSISLPVPAKEVENPAEEVQPGDRKKYEPVDFGTCLDMVTEAEAIEYGCPHCKTNVLAMKQTKFGTFPDVLIVHMKKFQLVNWMPTKVDVPVNIQDDLLLDKYQGRGLQDGEIELVGGEEEPAEPEFNEAAMAQLAGMGFPDIRCKKALLATGNNDPELAMNWLFEHMEDADIDDPIQSSANAAASSGPEPSAEQVAMIGDMGFTAAQAKKALRETGGDIERAVEWLFSHPDDTGEMEAPNPASGDKAAATNLGGSANTPANYQLKSFISHKGPSVHSGHYVSTVKQPDGTWVLFNDEKVMLADGASNEEMKSQAYIYIYQRL